MTPDLQSFLSSIYAAVLRKNGSVLSKLLSLPLNPGEVRQGLQSLQKERERDRETAEQVLNTWSEQQLQQLDGSLQAAVRHSLQAMLQVARCDSESAYRSQLAAFNAALEFFGNKEDSNNWIIPTFCRISSDLRLIAQKVDEEQNDLNSKLLRESLNNLTRGFTTITKDRSPFGPQSKKMALLAITNVLFKIYFKVNTMQLCSRLIGVIEGPGGVIESYREFPVSDVVMYKYYIGRIRMFEDRFEDARCALRFALKHIPAMQHKNVQRILAILVPIEMALGIMPTRTISETYGFPEYLEMGQAVTDGNIAKLNSLLSSYRHVFVKLGVYLVLEHTKNVALRNLFRKVYVITKNPRINIHILEVIFNWLGQTTTLDEIECFLTNLIYQGRIKGYISHEKRFLVVSKMDPFPKSAVIRPFT